MNSRHSGRLGVNTLHAVGRTRRGCSYVLYYDAEPHYLFPLVDYHFFSPARVAEERNMFRAKIRERVLCKKPLTISRNITSHTVSRNAYHQSQTPSCESKRVSHLDQMILTGHLASRSRTLTSPNASQAVALRFRCLFS